MADTQAGEKAPPSKLRSADPPRGLSGTEKVAALLLSMNKRLGSKLLKHFDEEDVKVIAQTASDLGTVSKAVLDNIIEEFAGSIRSGGDLMATADEVEQLLMGAVPPEQIAEIMSQVRSHSNQSIWGRLGAVPETILSPYLAKAHPQVSAFVLARAPPAYVANILVRLPNNLRDEIIRRMLSIKTVLEVPLKVLEETLTTDMLSRTGRDAGPTIHARLADIINKMDRKHMDEVLQDLEQHFPKDAELVRSLLFTFEDIAKLNQTSCLVLFDQVPPDRTITALYGADARLRELILEAVPTRSRRMIEQELESGKKPLTKEVNKARRAIADVALQMIESGVIDLNSEDE